MTVLKRGASWELETAEDSAGVADSEGVLQIEAIPEPMKPLCIECGCEVNDDLECSCIDFDVESYCDRCGAYLLIDEDTLCEECETDDDPDDEE